MAPASRGSPAAPPRAGDTEHVCPPPATPAQLDTAVLKYQNQKLSQKLEAQKIEISALENRLSQRKERQQPYNETLTVVNKCWEKLVDDLESCSLHTRGLARSGVDIPSSSLMENGAPSSMDDSFLERLTETGASESCSAGNDQDHMIEDGQNACEKSQTILHNIVAAVDDLWRMKDGLYAAVLMALPDDGSCRQKTSNSIEAEVKSLRSAVGDLHLKHKSLARELRYCRDSDMKHKVEIKYLRGELETAVRELEDSNCKLAALKAEKDVTKGAFFPVLNVGNKNIASGRVGDKQKDLQDMESALKELLDQSSTWLQELRRLHDERIGILEKLCYLQSTLKNVKSISSSQAFQLAREQLEKSKAEVIHYQGLFEKLQAAKDNLAWRERDLNVRSDIGDVLRKSCTRAESRLNELGTQIQKQVDERKQIERKLERASREPGRKEVIAEFKALLSAFPDDMSAMQSQLAKYKESAAHVHSLRAEVQSLTNVLSRKEKEFAMLSCRSGDQEAEIQRLRALVRDLKESDMDLNLILEMYRRESIVSRDILEARDSEYKAWAHVHSLKSSLDEHNLESLVKAAIEAEAVSQQRLAASEAEIADLRQKLEDSKRDMSSFTGVLKSKHEENEAYLSEIETIGQAYDDMQNQNQQLLKQITERDDYNIKLVLEGVKSRQAHDVLLIEKQILEKKIQQETACWDLFEMKAARIEDQAKTCFDQVQRLGEDRLKNSSALDNTRRKLMEAKITSQQSRDSLDELQCKVKNGRVELAELQIELEKERFEKKRSEEELEAVKRKAARLRASESSSVVEKLKHELQEYREILKCSICLDRAKEVVITKCYHLFCSPCIQKIVETRHRKCPQCAASFGPNDVKPVYI